MLLLCGMYRTNSFTWVESGSGDFLRRPVGGKEVPFRETWLMERMPLGWGRPGGMVGAGLGEREQRVLLSEVVFSSGKKSWCAVIRIQVSTTCRGKFQSTKNISPVAISDPL